MAGFDSGNRCNIAGVLGQSAPSSITVLVSGKKGDLSSLSGTTLDEWGNLYIAPTGPWEMQLNTTETIGTNLGTITNNYTAVNTNLSGFASTGCTGYYSGIISGTGYMTIKGGPENIGGVSYTGGGTIVYTNNNTYSNSTAIQTGATLQLGIDITSVNGKMVNSRAGVAAGAFLNIKNEGTVYPGTAITNGFENYGTINLESKPNSTQLINITNGTSTNQAGGIINILTGGIVWDAGLANNGTINLANSTNVVIATGTISGSGDIISYGARIVPPSSNVSFSFGAPTQHLIVKGPTVFGYANGIPTTGTPVFNWYAGLQIDDTLNMYGANSASGIFSDIRPNTGGATFTGSGTINLMAGYVCWGQAGGASAAAATYSGTINVKSGARMDLRNFGGAAAVGNFPTRNATVNIESGGLVAVVNSNGYAEIKSLSGATGGTLQLNSSGLQLLNQNPNSIVRSVISGAVALAVIGGTLNTEAVNTLTSTTTVGSADAGIGGGFATTGRVAALTMGGANSRLVVNPITTSTCSKLTCTNFSANSNAYKVDITGALDAGTYTILTATGSKNLNLPTIGVNNSGRTASFAWSGNNLQMTLV